MNQIQKSEIHIYRINFSLWKEYIFEESDSLKFLQSDELKKVNNLKFREDKERALMTFYLRRKILSSYLEISPEKIFFNSNRFGKPFIHPDLNSDIRFNYSHSGDYLILAVCNDSELGIDIEEIKEIPELEWLAENNFSDSEFLAFISFNNDKERLNFFYKIWTRKEAILKGMGTGITNDLKQIILFQPPINDSAFTSEFMKYNDWILSDLIVPENYLAALAYQSENLKKLVYFDTIL